MQTLTLPPDTQTVIDYCLTSKLSNNAAEALVFALSEPWSMQIAQDAQQAGLRCRSIDALPLALSRATAMDAKLATASSVGAVAAIDWGVLNDHSVRGDSGGALFRAFTTKMQREAVDRRH